MSNDRYEELARALDEDGDPGIELLAGLYPSVAELRSERNQLHAACSDALSEGEDEMLLRAVRRVAAAEADRDRLQDELEHERGVRQGLDRLGNTLFEERDQARGERDGLRAERDIAGRVLALILLSLRPDDPDGWAGFDVGELPAIVDAVIAERDELKDRLSHELCVGQDVEGELHDAKAELDRLRTLIRRAREARDPTVAIGLPPKEIGRSVRTYLEAVDRLLAEGVDREGT